MRPAFRRQDTFDLEREQHIFLNRAPVKQMIALQHIADLRTVAGLLTEQTHRAAGWLEQPHEHGQHRCFAAAGRPDDGHKFALLYGKAEIVYRERFRALLLIC